ncbi:endoplasmic oxidoreductin [Rhizophagus clarus]|uniref:Endoplasmic oxidoreductin n=1 Tax=Rhizophagus clarus TaxID=94130 RepID=A0A8H3R3Y4_9GLOM|nr:endoplasmic oxidoreductin [Rhizophagus clarus]
MRSSHCILLLLFTIVFPFLLSTRNSILALKSPLEQSRVEILLDKIVDQNYCIPSGMINDACCEFETVEKINNDLAPQLRELSKTSFFKYYKLKLYKECPFWKEYGMCMNQACAVETTDETNVPEMWRSDVLGALQTSQAGTFFQPFKKCEYTDQDFCVVEDESDSEGVFVNLLDNPERFTGYAGMSASRSRVYYRLISGLHSSISIHICDEYLNQTTGQWGPNLECFITRVASHPERLQNVYFTYIVLLRAISKAADYLNSYEFCTGDKNQDFRVKTMVSELVNAARSCPETFDEKQMFASPESRLLKEEFKARFRNVSRIMDCVGCDKCRLWGKLQISGLGTALKVLFSYDDEYLNPKVNPNLLTRTEIVALFNTLNRVSESLSAIERFRHMYQESILGNDERINNGESTKHEIETNTESCATSVTKNVTNQQAGLLSEEYQFVETIISIKNLLSSYVINFYRIIVQQMEYWNIPVPTVLHLLQTASSAIITPFFTSLASGDEVQEFLMMEMVDLMYRTTVDSENDKEAVYYKLEMLGYQVGQSLVERFTRDRPRFVDTLDVVKFICKDLWSIIFKKQIDNLKTNHRGVYVLQDNNFRWFLRMSTESGSEAAAKRSVPYLWFPCGLIRGALANLGVVSVVIAETNSLPQCSFQIKIAKS